MIYYNGVAFRGYVDGIPKGILSGGRYDRLAEKFGTGVKAIGFAIYPDCWREWTNRSKVP